MSKTSFIPFFSLLSPNKIYIDEDLSISKSFSDTSKTFFKSEPEQIEFSNRESASEIIKNW